MSLVLTKSQMKELTGTNQAARQMSWLDKNRWVYVIDCKGWPKVATAHYELRMGITIDEAAAVVTMPDWSMYGHLPAAANQS